MYRQVDTYVQYVHNTYGTVSEEVYAGLHAKIGADRINRFVDSLARPHVVDTEMDAAYKAMASDRQREGEATEWSDNLSLPT